MKVTPGGGNERPSSVGCLCKVSVEGGVSHLDTSPLRCPPALLREHRDLILGEGALLYVTYVMLIWAPITPATRWSYSQPPADSNDC